METINNATQAVKNTIWGEGQQQNTTGTGNTYDNTSSDNTYDSNTRSNDGTYDNTYDNNTRSNDNTYDNDNTTSNTTSSSTGRTGSGMKETHRSMIDDSVTETREFSGRTESDPMAEGAYDADRDRDKVVKQNPPPSQGANFTNQQDTNKNSMSNSNEPNTGFGGSGAQPSVTADPNSAQANDSHTHQGADRPNESPDDSAPSSGSGGSSGGPGGMKLPDNKSNEEGTGELWVKSSGLHADGGDFDATKPGAAREADRLMEEKGIKHGESGEGDTTGEPEPKKWFGVDHSGFGGHGSHANKPTSLSNPSGETAETSEPTEHKGIGSKIKDKLHH